VLETRPALTAESREGVQTFEVDREEETPFLKSETDDLRCSTTQMTNPHSQKADLGTPHAMGRQIHHGTFH